MPGKLHIKTFGCQRNEYDSAKMAEVLGVSHGMQLTGQAEEADVILLEHLLDARESAGEGVLAIRSVARAQATIFRYRDRGEVV